PVPAGFCLAMLVALLLARRQFDAPADPPSLLRLVRFVPLYVIAVLVFGFAGLLLQRGRMDPPLTLAGGLETIFAGLVGMDGPYTYHSPLFAFAYPAALLTLGSAGLAVFLVLLLRPLTARPMQSVEDWHHARELVRAHGWDTLAYFALRRDKSFFFGSDGQAMIAYTYLNGYALVSGDPIGAQGSVSQVVDEFLAMCSRRAWKPAFLAVRERDLSFYAARGFRSFYLGDEAVLRCDTFHTTGRGRKSLRAALRRVGKRYTFRLIPETSAPAELFAGLNALSAKWRGRAPERGFTMCLGQAFRGPGADPEVLLCVALDGDGRPGGFLRVVPAHGTEPGYTLDLMRHDPEGPNGMTEFLLASTATALAERGVTRLSMNFALWGRLFSRGPLTLRQRLARYAVGALNPFFQIKSLRDFNARFGPEWVPRRLVYRRQTDLPRIGFLYAGAERLLTVPGLGELFVPKAGGSATPNVTEPAGTPGAGTLGVPPPLP
ncbi:MAG TPA: phosphatidylglycerol lysyltransferase domain-containing protein, partial [Candidatus Binatia bacterium]|nr:phosphatidylglycerol lysyltransferase domain-containing protein [Candidatus Binatia bacterium]